MVHSVTSIVQGSNRTKQTPWVDTETGTCCQTSGTGRRCEASVTLVSVALRLPAVLPWARCRLL